MLNKCCPLADDRWICCEFLKIVSYHDFYVWSIHVWARFAFKCFWALCHNRSIIQQKEHSSDILQSILSLLQLFTFLTKLMKRKTSLRVLIFSVVNQHQIVKISVELFTVNWYWYVSNWFCHLSKDFPPTDNALWQVAFESKWS